MRFVDGLKAHYRDLQCDLSDTTSHTVTSSTALSARSSRSRKALVGKKGAGKKGGGDPGNKRFSTYGGNRSRSKSVFPGSEAAPETKAAGGQAGGEEQHSPEKSAGLGAKIMKMLSRLCPCIAAK